MVPINITLHPKNESQVEAIKAFMSDLNISFEISKQVKVDLTNEQQQLLDNQIGLKKNNYEDAQTVYENLMDKHEL